MSLANLFGGLSQGFNTFMALKQAQDEQNYRRHREGLEDADRAKHLQLETDRETREKANDTYRQGMDSYNAAAGQLGAMGIHGLTPEMMKQTRDGNQVQTGSGAGVGGQNIVGNALRSLTLAQQQPSSSRGPIDLGGGLVADPKESPFQSVSAGNQLFNYDKDKGTYTPGPEVHMNADQIAEHDADIALKREQARSLADSRVAAQGERKDKVTQVEADKFIGQNRDLYNRAATLNQSLRTMHDAVGQPVLYTSALVNFIQAADQKAQVRSQMVDYFKKNVDPSFTGTAEVLATRIKDGTYPPRVLQGLTQHVENLRNLAQGEWTTRRDWYVKHHPGSENHIPDADVLYGAGDQSEPSSPGAGSGQADPSAKSYYDSLKAKGLSADEALHLTDQKYPR